MAGECAADEGDEAVNDAMSVMHHTAPASVEMAGQSTLALQEEAMGMKPEGSAVEGLLRMRVKELTVENVRMRVALEWIATKETNDWGRWLVEMALTGRKQVSSSMIVP